MSTLKLDEDQLVRVTDILLGVAHADMDFDGAEAEEIANILESLVKGHLPDSVKARFEEFDPDAFDVEATCRELTFNARQRNAIFSLIARVIEADDIVDFEESQYLRSVASGLGAKPSEIGPYLVKFIELNPPPVP